MKNKQNKILFLALIASLLVLSACNIYGKDSSNLKPELRCQRWDVGGLEMTETDARLWCFTINQGQTGITCHSASATMEELSLIVESKNENQSQNRSLVFDNCIEYDEVLVKK